MKKIINLIIVISFSNLLISCDNTEPIFKQKFPMEVFNAYIPYNIGDTVFYDLYHQRGKNELLQLETNIPFVVTEIINNYKEGENNTYTNEYAEYGVNLFAQTDKLDSISLKINLTCKGRTRINVQYTADILYNHEYPTTLMGEYHLAASSDSLLYKFPTDSIIMENENIRTAKDKIAGILKKNIGLVHFYDMMYYQWKLSGYNYEE